MFPVFGLRPGLRRFPSTDSFIMFLAIDLEAEVDGDVLYPHEFLLELKIS